MKYLFIIFSILQLFVIQSAFADSNAVTIRNHARYVLRIPGSADDIAVYLYADDEEDTLCDSNIGSLCRNGNDHLISGNYKLFVLRDTLGAPEVSSIVSSIEVGKKIFNLNNGNNLQPKFIDIPGVGDSLISVVEDADSDGSPYSSIFMIGVQYKIYPVKFFLRTGKEFTDSGAISIKNQKLIMHISYKKTAPPREYLMKLPGKFDWKTLTQTISFSYKNGNFYENI